MNMMYHAAREATLDAAHRWLMFGVIAFGAASVVDLEEHHRHLKLLVGALVAVLGALDLTFDLSNRARTHSLMRRRYCEVLARAERHPDELGGVDAMLTEIGGEEEPVFSALLASCHNAAESAVYGDDKQHVIVPWYHHLLQGWWRFEGHVYADKHSAASES